MDDEWSSRQQKTSTQFIWDKQWSLFCLSLCKHSSDTQAVLRLHLENPKIRGAAALSGIPEKSHIWSFPSCSAFHGNVFLWFFIQSGLKTETPSRAAVEVTWVKCGRMRLLQTFKELLNYCQVEVLGVEVSGSSHAGEVSSSPLLSVAVWPKLLSKPALLLIATLHKSLRAPYRCLLSWKNQTEREDHAASSPSSLHKKIY